MTSDARYRTLLNIPLVEEKSGRPFFFSVMAHSVAFLVLIYGGYILPTTVIQIGSGAGGGSEGDVMTVGVVEELSGGTGMIKPSLVPKPPALLEEIPTNQEKAIALSQTLEPKRKIPPPKFQKEASKPLPKTNIAPVAPEPGSGGIGGSSGGSGGGFGGGIGVSIGSGSGGFGDSWYARAVEARISSNWIRPPEGVRVEMAYSFFIESNGTINGIKMEKSSGNPDLDLTAERAIKALLIDPLPPPPQEFRGRRIQFIAQFVYPPNR